MSWGSYSTEIITGWLSSAYAGHGILGADIPATGDSGESPLLNDGVSATSEYRWSLVTPPADGTLTMYEDTSFMFEGASDGVYTFIYRVYEDGVDQGTATVTLQVGPSVVTITAITADAVGSVASGGMVSCVINATTGDVVGSVGSASGVSVVLISAFTEAVSSSIQSTGYVAPMTLTAADLAAIQAMIPSAAEIAAAVWAKTLP